MNTGIVVAVLGGYFLLLIVIARITARGADTNVFFTAGRQSPWYLVAFGMIGASLSGVTFISVPGEVGSSQFTYFQMVLGYPVGYLIISRVLMPVYYKLKLVSIYSYLHDRFGIYSYRTGAFFFLLSRTVGASVRLFLVASVLQLALFKAMGIPFYVSVLVTIALIWLYTNKGGIKTIVITDTLQTLFMLVSVTIAIVIIAGALNLDGSGVWKAVTESSLSTVWDFEITSQRNFFKLFISGVFMTIVMTGLDQDMMQKNLTCRNLGEAQKNMTWFSVVLVFVNVLFLVLGALLYFYASRVGFEVPERTDFLFPEIALTQFGLVGGVFFLLGITAAAYSSADSALTSLTTSFCVDFLDFEHKEDELKKKKLRKIVHVGFSALLFVTIMIFQAINDESVVNSLFKAAGYTYGPLLGLFAYGLFTKRPVVDRVVPYICLLSPFISYLLNFYSEVLLWGYTFGFEILLVNGLITMLGLWISSFKASYGK